MVNPVGERMTSPGSEPVPVSPETVREITHLGLQLGRLLLQNGADTTQVQEAVERFAAVQGVQVRLLATYEVILLTVESGEQFRTKVGHRILAMNVNLSLVAAVNDLIREVEAGRCSLAQMRERLPQVEHQPPVYPRIWVALALGLTAASLARLFGGDWGAFGVTWAVSFVGTWLRQELGKRGANLFVTPFVVALVCGGLGALGASWVGTLTPTLCLIAPAMILVPGVPLVNGVQDLIRNQITLGLARLMLGVLITGSIAAGLMAATWVSGASIPVSEPARLLSIPEDALFSALAALGYLLLFNVPPRIAWAGVICGVASHTTRTAGLHLGWNLVLGTLVGALAAGFLAQAFARRFRAPAVTFAFPGVVAMIPGAFAFRAVMGAGQILNTGALTPTAVVNETLTLVLQCLFMVVAIAVGLVVPLVLPSRGS